MFGKVWVIAICVALAACASSVREPEEPAAEPTYEPPPAPDEPESPPAPDEPAEGSAPGGRLAFTTCDPDDRPQMCTKEYRPVCAEVDNGVRCVTTPCDSTDKKEFGNACTACADPKTHGYWPVPCAELR